LLLCRVDSRTSHTRMSQDAAARVSLRPAVSAADEPAAVAGAVAGAAVPGAGADGAPPAPHAPPPSVAEFMAMSTEEQSELEKHISKSAFKRLTKRSAAQQKAAAKAAALAATKAAVAAAAASVASSAAAAAAAYSIAGAGAAGAIAEANTAAVWLGAHQRAVAGMAPDGDAKTAEHKAIQEAKERAAEALQRVEEGYAEPARVELIKVCGGRKSDLLWRVM
jgi:hypothetical protein